MKTKLSYFLTFVFAFVVPLALAQAQTMQISGTVVDGNGVPIPGVNITVEGTTSGTNTDFDGNYSIAAEQGQVLVFSSVGFQDQQVTVGSETTVDVTLQEGTALDEVVVTALGIKRDKKSLGYASQEVKSDQLTGGTTNTGNLSSQLSGKISGLNVTTTNNFGGSSNLVIRGIKGITGTNPLIVIDGSPVNNTSEHFGNIDYGNALSDINQEDVASINVLKGAAASALYGERGLNGVILITTKNGQGKDDGSWGVTVNTGVQVGFMDKSTFPTYQDKYGAGYDMSFYNEPDNPDGSPYANFPEDASWGPKFDPNLLVYQWDSFDESSPNFGKPSPWVAAKHGPDYFFETPVTYTNSVSLQKGDSDKNILFSYDNMISEGMMPNSDLTKNTISLKTNYNFTDKLHASLYSTLTFQKTNGRSITGYSDNIVTLFRQWWQTNVDLKDQKRAYLHARQDPSAVNAYGNVSWNVLDSENAATPQYWNNPYFQAYESSPSDRRFRSFNIASLGYDFTDNLSVEGKVSYDRSTLGINGRLAMGSLSQTFGAAGANVSSGYERRDITKEETNYDLHFNYKFDITEDMNISGVAGGNIRRNNFDSFYASTEGGLVVPFLYSLGNSTAAALPPAEDQYVTQTNSLFASASLDINKTFFIDGTYRVDRSSTLPRDNNTYGYGSITGAVILSELMDDADWLDFWKVRGNYAEVGGTTDPYQLQYYYESAGFFGETGMLQSQTRLPNPDLKPQRAKEFEFGMEGSFFDNRLSFDLAYYKTKTMDQIIPELPISTASGLSSASINAGQIDNTGFEVQLGITPIRTEDFTWQMDINWSTNKNKVVELLHTDRSDVSNYLLDQYQGGVSLNAREGEAWGALVGSDYVYHENGQPIIDPETGYYQKQSNQIIGNAFPDWIGGIRNSLNYKGISLSFLIDMRHGGDVFSTDMWYGTATGLFKESAEGNIREEGQVFEGVNPDGQPNTTVTKDPSEFGNQEGYARMPNKRYIYDGSYVKLREASIGYTLPKSVIENTFLDDVKVSLVGRNLWIIHKNLPYADPESMVGGGLNAYGWSIGALPTMREFGLNLTLKF